MSCGNSSEVDCGAVLAQVQEYLHRELDEEALALIHDHLLACGPCLSEYGLEQVLRELIHRSCTCTPAPERLRISIVARLSGLRLDGAPS